jgi:hypothetical protein
MLPMGSRFRFLAPVIGLAGILLLWWRVEADPDTVAVPGESPTLAAHVNQADIDGGAYTFGRLFDTGQEMFQEPFNRLDGAGRPAATGNGTPTHRDPANAPRFLRTSSPEAMSCAGCHNQPFAGGAGDFVANVFVLAQNLDPVTESVGPEASDERNTLGMNGSGAIEMLAREMTAQLQSERDAALAQAASSGQNVTVALSAKSVSFGAFTGHPDGTGDASGVQGVDVDLVIKPFSQKGVVVSLRVFTNNAFNHHHGMESVERFGVACTGMADFDQDGVPDELSEGDITAVTIFQAGLGVPGRVVPNNPDGRDSASRGEMVFSQIGCAACHVPQLTLDNPVFSEPNPYNPVGNLRISAVAHPFTFDLTRDLVGPNLDRTPDGKAIVRAYTDLKRHVICDDQHPYFCNEQLPQNGVPTNKFLTRKLWDVGNTAPYGHRGDIDTIGEAILDHGGEATAARDAFEALPAPSQVDLCNFLKSLQVLPEGITLPRITPRQARTAGSIRARAAAGPPKPLSADGGPRTAP